MFVFATMVEFAFILFVRQKQLLKNITENCGSDIANAQNHSSRHDGGSKDIHDVISETTEVRTSKEIKGNEIKNIRFGSKRYNMLRELPYTTKIDLASFILFHIIYLIFNIGYWANVLNLLYNNN